MAAADDRRTELVATLRAAGCVFAEAEAELLLAARAVDPGADLEVLVARRVAGSPLEHVLGWAEFCGLHVQVGAGVFVPRRRTELLVRVALDRLRAVSGRPVVVDLCCGTGAVAAAVAAAVPDVELYAADLDPVAAGWARRNLAGRGTVWCGDLFAPLPSTLRGRVDLVVASAPYVPTDAIALLPPEARLHEPRQALDGGPDGLVVYRRLIAAAPGWLNTDGRLVVETSAHQAEVVADLVRDRGLASQVVSDEEDSTVVIGSASVGSVRADALSGR
ncbi:MAG: putative protein N(5)-glutamine methyltransferase [Propionibacteriaceae bacterium]